MEEQEAQAVDALEGRAVNSKAHTAHKARQREHYSKRAINTN